MIALDSDGNLLVAPLALKCNNNCCSAVVRARRPIKERTRKMIITGPIDRLRAESLYILSEPVCSVGELKISLFEYLCFRLNRFGLVDEAAEADPTRFDRCLRYVADTVNRMRTKNAASPSAQFLRLVDRRVMLGFEEPVPFKTEDPRGRAEWRVERYLYLATRTGSWTESWARPSTRGG